MSLLAVVAGRRRGGREYELGPLDKAAGGVYWSEGQGFWVSPNPEEIRRDLFDALKPMTLMRPQEPKSEFVRFRRPLPFSLSKAKI